MKTNMDGPRQDEAGTRQQTGGAPIPVRRRVFARKTAMALRDRARSEAVAAPRWRTVMQDALKPHTRRISALEFLLEPLAKPGEDADDTYAYR